MEIFVMRHGKCVDNEVLLNGTLDKPLVEEGRQQAVESARKLIGENIKMIYSSPLSRAYETAMIVAKILDPVDVDIEPRLIERHFGILTGRPITDIPLFSKDIIYGDKVRYFLDTEGAEHYDTVYERAQAVLRKVLDLHAGQNVLLVAHGAIGQVIRAAYYGFTWQECLEKMPYFGNTDIIRLNGVKPNI